MSDAKPGQESADSRSTTLAAPSSAATDRRRFLWGTGLATGALALGAAGRARAADRVEISFASAKFFGKETLAEVVEAYNQSQTKVHVTYVELPPPSSSTEVHQALVQQLARRTGTPDVFTQDVVWIAEFAGAGWALPLGEYFDAAAQKDYFPGTIAACTFDGKLTALPWFVDSGMLYYRKDLLEGMGAKVPETWADLTKTAQELMKSGKADFGYLWQGKQAEVLVCDLVSIIASNNGAILAPDGNPAGDDAMFVRAGLHAAAAAVGRLRRGLLQKQALLGGGRKRAAASTFLDERLVIQGRLEAQQAEAEPVLAAGLAVTAARIAAQFREDRHDLVREVDGRPAAKSSTLTATLAVSGPRVTTIEVEPSPRGVTTRRLVHGRDLRVAARIVDGGGGVAQETAGGQGVDAESAARRRGRAGRPGPGTARRASALSASPAVAAVEAVSTPKAVARRFARARNPSVARRGAVRFIGGRPRGEGRVGPPPPKWPAEAPRSHGPCSRPALNLTPRDRAGKRVLNISWRLWRGGSGRSTAGGATGRRRPLALF